VQQVAFILVNNRAPRVRQQLHQLMLLLVVMLL
jgi:hypothetical protein